MNPLSFLHQVREELVKVTWPTRQETLTMTLIVVGVSIAVGLYVGGLDTLFTALFETFIRR